MELEINKLTDMAKTIENKENELEELHTNYENLFNTHKDKIRQKFIDEYAKYDNTYYCHISDLSNKKTYYRIISLNLGYTEYRQNSGFRPRFDVEELEVLNDGRIYYKSRTLIMFDITKSTCTSIDSDTFNKIKRDILSNA